MDNLVLVGFSCSGKTTVGRMLARRLHMPFVDTDKLVEDTTGRSVADLFRDEGEAAFRLHEREAVLHACRERLQIVSTGGGAFADSPNQAVLRDGNLVVHLRVQPHTVVERLQNSRSGRPRPLLDASDPLLRVTELLAARLPAYALAQIAVDADNRPVHDLVAQIARHWREWRRGVEQRSVCESVATPYEPSARA